MSVHEQVGKRQGLKRDGRLKLKTHWEPLSPFCDCWAFLFIKYPASVKKSWKSESTAHCYRTYVMTPQLHPLSRSCVFWPPLNIFVSISLEERHYSSKVGIVRHDRIRRGPTYCWIMFRDINSQKYGLTHLSADPLHQKRASRRQARCSTSLRCCWQ